MSLKSAILETFRPRAVLLALSSEAGAAVPAAELVDNMVAIRRLPFRVGRESRVMQSEGQWIRRERIALPHSPRQEPNNDLYLFDACAPLQISRAHLTIDLIAPRQWRVIDRGSAHGTLIGDRFIGGREGGGEAPLADGDLIVLGDPARSPYRFRFIDLV
ncbi:MAG: FHA domain-containing protein [Pseudomonadales bacterium]